MIPLLLSILFFSSDPNFVGPPEPIRTEESIIRMAALQDFSRNFLKQAEVIWVNDGKEVKTYVYYNPWDLNKDGIVNMKDWNLLKKGRE